MSKSISIRLPQPKLQGRFSLEKSLLQRRSFRAYKKTPLSIGEISQLLFAGQGVIDENRRTVPSAGALYPIEVYLVAGRIKGIPAGIYKYQPQDHSLDEVSSGDKRRELAAGAFSQFWVKEAPATIALCGNFQTTTKKYRERGKRFVIIEIGHAAQNICLQSTSLGLGSLCVGGFDDESVKRLLDIKLEPRPFYLIPVGKIFKNYVKKEAEIIDRFYKFLETNFLENVY